MKSRSEEVAQTFRLLRAFRSLRNPADRHRAVEMVEALLAKNDTQEMRYSTGDQTTHALDKL
ncbi:hypothetical protein AS156_18695 [Bradyrhizobium macuxiense]|uniref:Uncharacterized protein n=1 Tax=Bradyrhizobium macuxiense TaxID=1755647 RepID=A0A120FJ38_9BRAD|nr:hypothetical protein [Bradyrhizobium macuxiense]KWV48500.1 hypothetical protein AS156_18695 [Bradyrhizobium macuxiense]